MTRLDEDTKVYLEMFKNKNFTEQDFVSFLLPLLCKNGAHKINEDELIKKLYYYYANPRFRELFTDICPSRGTLDKEVDIHNGLYREKYFSGCIIWDSMNSNVLHLHYDRNIDLSKYESMLSENGIMLMHEMAQDLATRNKTESYSRHKMVIYGCDPNKEYTLVRGQHGTNTLSWELLTDGNIKTITYPNPEELKHCFFDSPLSPNYKVQLGQNVITSACLENASYAVMQGLCDREIKYLEVFTNLSDFEQLSKISDIANAVHTEEDNLLTEEEPYVRKLVLK